MLKRLGLDSPFPSLTAQFGCGPKPIPSLERLGILEFPAILEIGEIFIIHEILDRLGLARPLATRRDERRRGPSCTFRGRSVPSMSCKGSVDPEPTFFRSDGIVIPRTEPSRKRPVESSSTLLIPDFLLPDGHELVLIPLRIS